MQHPSTGKKTPIKKILILTLLTGLVAFLVALPMIGVETVVENGIVVLNPRLVWVVWFVAVIMAGRLLSLQFAAQIDKLSRRSAKNRPSQKIQWQNLSRHPLNPNSPNRRL